MQDTILDHGNRMNAGNKRQDFASLRAGAYVIYPLTSKTYARINSWRGVWQSLSFAVPVARPEVALAASDDSTESCWPFYGSAGELGIGLNYSVMIDGVTIEHIGVDLTQDAFNAAPQAFELWGVKGNSVRDFQYELLHEGSYSASSLSPIQTFNIEKPRGLRTANNKVLLKILTNHGNPAFTCLYRVRIHGQLEE